MKQRLVETIERQKKLMGILSESSAAGGYTRLIEILEELLNNGKRFFADINLPTSEFNTLARKGINNLEELRAALVGGLKKGLTHEYVGGTLEPLIIKLLKNKMVDGTFDVITQKILPELFDMLNPQRGVELFAEYTELLGKSASDNVRKLKFLKLLEDLGADETLRSFVKRTLKVTAQEAENTPSQFFWKEFFNGVKLSLLEIPGLQNLKMVKDALLREYKRNLKSFQDLNSKFMGLVSQYRDIVFDDPLKADEIVKEMKTTLEQILLVSGNNTKTIYERWKEILPKEYFKDLEGITDPEWKNVFRKFEQGVAKVEPTDVIISRLEAFLKIFKPPSDVKWYQLNKNFGQRFLNLMQRAGGLFVYMDARKLSEIQTNYKLLGGARWIGKGTMDRFLSATVYWPTAYMLLKTAGEYIEAKTPIGVPGISDEEAKKHIAGGGEDITNLFRVAGQNWWKGFLFSGDHFTKLTGQSPLLAAVFENVYGLDKPSENDPKKKTKAEELKERVRQEWVRDSTAAKQKLDSIKAEGQRQIQYLDSLKKALNPTYIDTMVKNVEKVEY